MLSPTKPTTSFEPASDLCRVAAACNASRADLASEPSASVYASNKMVSINLLAAKRHKRRKIKPLLTTRIFLPPVPQLFSGNGVHARPHPGPLPRGEGGQGHGAG